MFAFGLDKFRGSLAAFALVIGASFAASPSQAATCPVNGALLPTDPGHIDGQVQYMTLEDTSGATCLDSGTESNPDSTNGVFRTTYPNYTVLAKEEDGNGALDGIITGLTYDAGDGDYGIDGEISFVDTGLTGPFAILFKFGNDNQDSWFAWSVSGGFTNADWALVCAPEFQDCTLNGLSHVTLFAAPIPVPAAGILLITALGGLGFAARRRRKAS